MGVLIAAACGAVFGLATMQAQGAVPGVASAPALSVATVAPGMAEREPKSVAFLTIEDELPERPAPLGWLMGGKERTLSQFVAGLEKLANDPNTGAVVIRLKDAELKAAQVDELGAAIKKVRDAGKKVSIFAESYGPTELLLAAHADEAIAQTGAPVALPGLYMEEMFLADTLNWAGVHADMIQVGDYKGANEQMSRNAPSPAWDQNINQLLDSMYANMRSTLKKGRKLDDAGLDAAMEKAWMCQADEAKKAGLIDAEADLPMLKDHFEQTMGVPVSFNYDVLGSDDHHAKTAAMMSNPLAMLQILAKKPDNTPKGPTIAVLHISGVIVDGDSKSGGLFGGGQSVGSRTIRNAIEEILREDLIKGVIVRIESPGGSAVASEVMWQGLRRLAAKKPVWASVGGMAASGGYYVAVGTDKIYANPSSILGSIGVVGGRLSMDGLYDKLKVNVVSRTRGPKAGMFRSTTPWTPDEVTIVRQKMTETYELFTKRVSQGRKGIDISKTAEGRLFTGDKAKLMGMADEIGGLELAVTDLAKSLKLEDFKTMDYPSAKSLEEVLEDAIGGMAAAGGGEDDRPLATGAMLPRELAMPIRAVVGERAWPQVRDGVQGLMQLREHPVILMSPRIMTFK